MPNGPHNYNYRLSVSDPVDIYQRIDCNIKDIGYSDNIILLSCPELDIAIKLLQDAVRAGLDMREYCNQATKESFLADEHLAKFDTAFKLVCENNIANFTIPVKE